MSKLGWVSVDENFGWVGDSSNDDTAAVQAALNTKRNVFVPAGRNGGDTGTKLTAPVYFMSEGQTIEFENSQKCLVVSASGTSHDFFRVGLSRCSIVNGMYRPGSANNCFARVYAPGFRATGNRALSASSGSGSVFKFVDVNPVTSAFVAGAYAHIIERNWLGYPGYAFDEIIEVGTPTGGLQACKFLNNDVNGDRFISYDYGGGNTYFGNLFRSITGTAGTPAGDCIDLGATVHGDIVLGNYFDRHAYAVKAVNNDWKGHDLNHYDNVTNIPAGPASGIPSGGTTSQILVKTSGADYAVGWEDAPSGGGSNTAVYYGGDENNAASGSGSDYLHDLVHQTAANALALGKSLRITANFTFSTSGSPPSLGIRLYAGSTKVCENSSNGSQASVTANGIAMTWIITPQEAPSASSNVSVANIVQSQQATGVNYQRNTVAQPIALPTNATIDWKIATLWTVPGSGGTTKIKLDSLIAELI